MLHCTVLLRQSPCLKSHGQSTRLATVLYCRDTPLRGCAVKADGTWMLVRWCILRFFRARAVLRLYEEVFVKNPLPSPTPPVLGTCRGELRCSACSITSTFFIQASNADRGRRRRYCTVLDCIHRSTHFVATLLLCRF